MILISVVLGLVTFALIFMRVYPLVVAKYQGYATNYVFNYVLQNNKRDWLARLWQRNPTWNSEDYGWYLKRSDNKDHGYLLSRDGFIKKREVTSLGFYLVVFFIFGWLDADCNAKYTDAGYLGELVGQHRGNMPEGADLRYYGDEDRSNHWIGRHFHAQLLVEYTMWAGVLEYGNWFDLGDLRDEVDHYNTLAHFLFNDRNPMMGFKYLFRNY